jgi:glucose/mannose-6-phosphate isomerase
VAKECAGRPLLIIAAEHLVGNAHAFQNQVNETAKQICHYDTLPELNHHRLEGLTNPKGTFKGYTVLMVRSGLYHSRNQLRFDLTADVFEKLGAKVIDYNCGGGSRLEEVAELLQFGTFVSYYMSMLNKVDGPEKTPYVDWFKEKLAKK